MGEVLSYGQNRRWRRFLVSRIPSGARVLDVATGTAAVAIDLVHRRGATVVGLDQSERMLRAGRGRADEARVPIELLLGQAERLPFPDAAFDAVTFTYLLRYVDDPRATLDELTRVLRPGGTMASLEFGMPSNPALRLGWRAQTMVALPVLGSLASAEWRDAGRFLGPSIQTYRRSWPPAREAEAWERAGMREVRVREMAFGAGVVMWGTKGAR
jgi:demethylmenaquinone methyltransferase/2-methoxy-6-polyprenyl-1,4-benzoquinol methylase